MNSKWALILGAFAGTAEETIPIFIHNPQSQKIEGIVVTAGNQLFETLATILSGTQTATTPAPASK